MLRLQWRSPLLVCLLTLIVGLPASAQTGTDDEDETRKPQLIEQPAAIHLTEYLAEPDTESRYPAFLQEMFRRIVALESELREARAKAREVRSEASPAALVPFSPYKEPVRRGVGGISTAAALFPDSIQEGEEPGFTTAFGLNLMITGHVKLDIMASDNNPDFIQGDFVILALPEGSAGLLNGKEAEKSFFSMGFRESRLTFISTGPEFLGAQTSALFTIDGMGFGNTSDIFTLGNDAAGAARFHMGWIDLTWDNALIRAGNQLTLWGNHFYDGALNADFNRGGWYLNMSGVMGSVNLLGSAIPDKSYTLDLGAGVYRSPSFIFGLNGLVNEGELSGTPMINGRLRFSTDKLGTVPIAFAGFTGFFDRSASLEVVGIWAQQDYGQLGTPTGEFTTRGIEVRGTLPIIPRRGENRAGLLGITGQYYNGQNLCAGFETGLQCLVQEGGRTTEAEGWGAIGAISLFVTDDLSFYGRFGITKIDRHDGVVVGVDLAGGLRRTETIVGGFWYQPTAAPNLLMGIAYKRFDDEYQNGDTGTLNFFRPQIYFRF